MQLPSDLLLLYAHLKGDLLKNTGSIVFLVLLSGLLSPTQLEAFDGPLRQCAGNPRYFSDESGIPIFLTGSHTWANLADMSPSDPPEAFDFETYLNWLVDYRHNFVRLWTWELVSWDTRGNRENKRHTVWPHPWARVGPGKALDGKPKFDLTAFNDEYFSRLRSRLEAAAARNIYVSVMLFEGWGLQFSPGAWASHPFHKSNNINEIDGDIDGDGSGLEVHTLANQAVTELQKSYVKHVVDLLNDLDNLLFEISNENHPPSTQWQYEIIEFIHEYERSKPKQHPVGMTFQYEGGSNADLFASPADWISPNPEGGYREDPPPADGQKVILNDTDHLWGIGGNEEWVWKSFLRGHNPLFMDPYDGVVLGNPFEPEWDPIRKALGYSRIWAQQIDLNAMVPSGDLTSSSYCLADIGEEYLIYVPGGGQFSVDLTAASGMLVSEWFDTSSGVSLTGNLVRGGEKRLMNSPFGEKGLVLHLKKTRWPPEKDSLN
jgi:hypothetical protein